MRIRPTIVVLPLLAALACNPTASPGGPPPPADDAVVGGDVQPGSTSGDQAQQPSDSNVATPDAEIQARRCRKKPRADGTLVARPQVTNTGNVGVVVRVAAVWPQGRDRGISLWKQVRIDEGDTITVRLKATLPQEHADAVLRALERGRRCYSSRRIVGAFGIPGD